LKWRRGIAFELRRGPIRIASDALPALPASLGAARHVRRAFSDECVLDELPAWRVRIPELSRRARVRSTINITHRVRLYRGGVTDSGSKATLIKPVFLADQWLTRAQGLNSRDFSCARAI